jgi:EAL and modified HD-GYP domain-containing signal transduction protein
VEALRPYRVKLLAEKIETYEVLERCRGLGFDYFQGYFLSKPRDFAGRKIRENRVTLMQLLAKIHNPNIEFREIERLIKQDPVISFKLLRLINSAAFNLVRKIRSLKEAITMLGIDQIRRWATLLSLHEGTDKPLELSATTLTRAQMCYLIAQKVCPRDAESCFTVGLFSTLDAFLDAPIKKVLAELPLSKELVDAIVYRTGGAGRILDNVVAHEEARWEDIDLRGWPRFNEAELALAYRKSIEWVAQTAITATPSESGTPVDPSDSACEALVPVVPDTDAACDPDRERKQSESVLQTAPGP